jgi:hypothetical protein
MLKPIIVVAVCIFALMVALKDGRVLRSAGLTGYCKVIKTLPDSTEVAACYPGKLEGRPDLTRRACKSIELTHSTEYWRCPTGFDVSDARR